MLRSAEQIVKRRGKKPPIGSNDECAFVRPCDVQTDGARGKDTQMVVLFCPCFQIFQRLGSIDHMLILPSFVLELPACIYQNLFVVSRR